MSLNPVTWSVWAVAALAAALIDRNPYLQLVLLMVLINVWLRHGRARAGYWKIGAVLALTPVLFTFAFSRFGHTVLFRLPDIPILGGAWTLEALLFGASTGLALLLVVAVFGILQSTVRSAELLSLLPGPLSRAGTVFALAVAFAPQTVGSLRAISEARNLRGQRSGWRAAHKLLVPLLLTTMERALQYGESLDARGFGNHRRSRYQPLQWHSADYLVMAASCCSLLVVLFQPATAYNPYLEMAPLFPRAASLFATLALSLPAIPAGTARRHHATDLV